MLLFLLLSFQYLHSDNCMPRPSMPHMHKALSCSSLKTFISVTKEVKQRERIIAFCLDEVLHLEAQKRNTRLCLPSVCPFTFSSMKCYLVLFLYYQLIVRSSHSPLCISKEAIGLRRCRSAVYKCTLVKL